MAIISTILGNIDDAVNGAGSNVYSAVAAQAFLVAKAGAILAVVMTGINIMMQVVPISIANGISIIARIGVVFVFLQGAGSYSNFHTVFSAITDAPASFGAITLGQFSGGTVPSLNVGLDQLYLKAVNTGQSVMDNGGYISGPIIGIAFWMVAALMAVFTIIILGASKIAVAAMIILGPVAIACTLFKSAAPFFEAWVKLTMGFALVPMIAAAMSGMILWLASKNVPSDLTNVQSVGDLVNFIVIMVLGCGLMLMVPSMASSLSAASINLMAVAGAAAGLAKGGMALDRKGQQVVGGAIDAARNGGAAKAASAASSGATMAAGTAVSLAKKMAGR